MFVHNIFLLSGFPPVVPQQKCKRLVIKKNEDGIRLVTFCVSLSAFVYSALTSTEKRLTKSSLIKRKWWGNENSCLLIPISGLLFSLEGIVSSVLVLLVITPAFKHSWVLAQFLLYIRTCSLFYIGWCLFVFLVLCGCRERNVQVSLPPWIRDGRFGAEKQVYLDSSLLLHSWHVWLFFCWAQMKHRILLYNTVI